MSLTAERLRWARKSANLTYKELSSFTGISEKSLMRYENDESTPDAYNIKTLASVYYMSIDYLLGISNDRTCNLTDDHSLMWYQYQKTLKNKVMDSIEYYWIEFDPKKELIPTKGAMQWCGERGNEELYNLRPVKPKECIHLINQIYGIKPLIINCEEDWTTFLLYGIHGIVAENICNKCAPYLMRPGTVTKTRPAP